MGREVADVWFFAAVAVSRSNSAGASSVGAFILGVRSE